MIPIAPLLQSIKYRVRIILLAALQSVATVSRATWCPTFLMRPFMIASLSMYRATLSRFVGRDCLFHPSCSQRALYALRTLPFKEAMQDSLEQVMGCNPNYRLRSEGAGWIMTTSNGRSYREGDLSQGVVGKLGELRSMPSGGVGGGGGAR